MEPVGSSKVPCLISCLDEEGASMGIAMSTNVGVTGPTASCSIPGVHPRRYRHRRLARGPRASAGPPV